MYVFICIYVFLGVCVYVIVSFYVCACARMADSKYILQTLLIESRRLCIVLSASKSRRILSVAKSLRAGSDLVLRFTANYLQVIGFAYI